MPKNEAAEDEALRQEPQKALEKIAELLKAGLAAADAGKLDEAEEAISHAHRIAAPSKAKALKAVMREVKRAVLYLKGRKALAEGKERAARQAFEGIVALGGASAYRDRALEALAEPEKAKIAPPPAAPAG